MATLESLHAQLPEIHDIQMRADGYALWMVWQGDINPVVIQTLEDYGGIRAAGEAEQSLWFYFSTEVLLAAARIGVWARFNHLAVTMQVFPVRFQVDKSGREGLIFDEALWRQTLGAPTEFTIMVHTSMAQMVEMAPGLSLKEQPPQPGMAPGVWASLEVDARLPYQSSLGWYTILRPIGNPLDKAYQTGWREFFAQVETILQRNKFRFTVHDSFVMFPLENVRQLKNWCRDFLAVIARLKVDSPQQYWPCVQAIVERKGLNFNEDLHKKVSVEWEHLTPDFPHMSMRSALILGEEFTFHEVRFATAKHTQEDWCSISLRGEGEGQGGSLPQLASVQLAIGPHPHCFYCGQHSHETKNCPSRIMEERDPQLWNHIAHLNFDDMQKAVLAIDDNLAAAPAEEAGRTLAIAALAKDTSHTGLMLRAFYDLTWYLQLRSLGFFWRARTKDFHKAAQEPAPLDSNPIWAFLATYTDKTPVEADKELASLATRFPKDFRIMSMRGFAAMEQGDPAKAIGFWKEAEMYSTFPVVQAWHAMLQARAWEFQGRFAQAIPLYEQVMRTCPSWLDADYRKLVCEVKSGFSERALSGLTALVDRNGHYFNKALFDGEMERGHIQISECLYGLWTGIEARAKEEVLHLNRLTDELAAWLPPENAFAVSAAERIQKLLRMSAVSNYMPFQMLVAGRVQLEKDLQLFLVQEGKGLKSRFKVFIDRLRVIQEDSLWFPFPRALVEFNKNYNQAVANINWVLTANLFVPEAFRKAHALSDAEDERLKKLEGRMRFLRIVRDATLFMLSMAESFFWLELVGILAIFVILPLILLYGDKIGLEWTAGIISTDRWQVQKALFLVVTIMAVGTAGLRTLLRFEKIRDTIFAKARAGTLKKKKK